MALLTLPSDARQSKAAASHPIRLTGKDTSDLAFLKTALDGVRIVQLGENGHGASESMQARARIARFLHEEMGFGVLAFESSLFLCHLADGRIVGSSPRQTLISSIIGVWHIEEMLPLFTYLTETRATGSPLRLAGFDVQPIGSRRRERSAFLGGIASVIDPEYGKEVLALETEFHKAYESESAGRRQYLRQHGDAMATRYDALAAFIEQHLARLQKEKGREAPLVAAQEARSAAAYIRFQIAPDMRQYAEKRDRGMFENLQFLAERLFPDQKIIVWGHNFHLRHDNVSIPPREEVFPGVAARTMGTWTREHFRRRVFTIGEYAAEGRAVDNSRAPYSIAPPPTGSLERQMAAISDGVPSIVVVRDSNATTVPWAWSPLPARYNGQHQQTLVAGRQYDALLFLPAVNPPRFLY